MQEFAKGVYGKVFSDNDGYVYKVFYTDNKSNESGWIREVVALKNLHHPNIISPKYIGLNFSPDSSITAEPNMYIKMKKYSRLLQIERPLCDIDIMQCLLDMFNGLAYMHSHLVMHRDIKEANLLYEPVTSIDEIKAGRQIKQLIICDFSLARYTINTSDIKHFNYLTPETITLTHRPPEVFQAHMLYKKNGLMKVKIEYNELVDVWSVGIVLFFLLTNTQLYHAIFVYGKDDEEFINFISQIDELASIRSKLKTSKDNSKKLTGEDCEKIFTYLMLSDSAILCIKRWLSIHVNHKLKHLSFFKSIMMDCLANVNERPSAANMAYKLSKYILDNDLTTDIIDHGCQPNIIEQKLSPVCLADDKKSNDYILRYIYKIVEPALPSVRSREVRSLVLKKMTIILSKLCLTTNKNISEINSKYVIAAAHIVEILFLYANIFTEYFAISYKELYKYINSIFIETDYLADLF